MDLFDQEFSRNLLPFDGEAMYYGPVLSQREQDFYYNKLLKKLKRTSSENIVKKRIRIHNLQKFIVIARSYVKYQLNLIQWI